MLDGGGGVQLALLHLLHGHVQGAGQELCSLQVQDKLLCITRDTHTIKK